MGAAHGPHRRRQHRGTSPFRPSPRGELPALRGHQHVSVKAPYTEDVTEGGATTTRPSPPGIPVRRGGHDLPPGHALGPQGVRKISALYTPYNYRDGHRPARADDALRRRRRLHHSRQYREEPRPDQRAAPMCSRRAAAGDYRARPFHRFPLCARASPSAPRRRSARISTAMPTSREKDLDERMHTPLTPGWFPPRRNCRTCRRRTSARSAKSAAGRCRARPVKVARERGETNSSPCRTWSGWASDRTAEMGPRNGLGRGRTWSTCPSTSTASTAASCPARLARARRRFFAAARRCACSKVAAEGIAGWNSSRSPRPTTSRRSPALMGTRGVNRRRARLARGLGQPRQATRPNIDQARDDPPWRIRGKAVVQCHMTS